MRGWSMTHPTLSLTQSLLAAWSSLLDREPSERPRWLRWSVAVGLTVLALWLRILIGSPESGARFATLTLAAVLAGLYGGFSACLISMVVGLLLANFFLIAPFGQAAVTNLGEALWLNLTFVTTQMVVLGAIWVMQKRHRRLHEVTRELTNSQKKFRNTFEHAAAGITHVGLKGELLDINQTFCKLVGYSEAALRNMRFQDITHPDDLAPDVNLLKETLAGQRAHYELEKRYIHKDGHLIWAKLTVALMRTPEGDPDYFISVVQDISGLKAAEEALRNSERQMHQAQNAAGFIPWEADLVRKRFRTFGQSHRIVGLPAPEFGIEEILRLTHPEDHAKVQKEWAMAVKGQGHYSATYRGHPDLPFRWYYVRADFERDENGRALRALGVTQDISTRKLAELEVQRLNASLEQRIQERTRELKGAYAELESYSYAVAHDLRSPLRIINGFAQALEEDNQHLDDASLIHIHRIKSSSRKMGLLIDGLLKLSRYAREEIQRQPINISFIAIRLLNDLRSEQPERNVQWTVEPNMHTEADPALIEALLQNLLHNAWKYTEHTAAASIRVERKVIEGDTHYCVSDNGAGFDMTRAGKLFQPFQRLHMPHEFEGLGVGLATARRIVQRHGGEMRAEGSPGQGACFSFTLPRTPSHKTSS